MSKNLSFDDIIASHEKFGCVFKLDLTKVKDQSKEKKGVPIIYIQILFKHINGKFVKCSIDFSDQIIASAAKIPYGTEDGKTPKNLIISIQEMSMEIIESGDYVPKQKDSKEAQEIENTRMANLNIRRSDNNKKFVKILSIIDDSYKTLCNELISTEKDLPFKLKRDKKKSDININSIKQSTITKKDDDGDDIEEKMEFPINRLKLGAYNGNIGIYTYYNKLFTPNVYDIRKMTEKNKYKPVLATVKINGKTQQLDVFNANLFITYKSLIGGTVVFDSIISSKFGLSLSNKFYEIFVCKHKSKSMQQSITVESIIAMRGGIDDDDDGSDSECVVDVETKKNSDDEEEEYEEEEDDEDDVHDSDDEIEQSNAVIKKISGKK